jgi:hypothetical protein
VDFQLLLRSEMPDRRGRSYREWSSNESESEESESDNASEQMPLPPRARTLAVEPSPFTVTSTQEAMPFALDVSAILPHVSRRSLTFFSVVFLYSRGACARGISSCSPG